MESIEKGTPSSAAAADGKESELKIASSPSIKRRKSLKDFNFARLNSIGKVSFIHELLNFATHFYAGACYANAKKGCKRNENANAKDVENQFRIRMSSEWQKDCYADKDQP